MKKIILLIIVLMLFGCNKESELIGDYYDNRNMHAFTFKPDKKVVLIGVSEAGLPYNQIGNLIKIASPKLISSIEITIQTDGSLASQNQIFVKK